MANRDYEIYSDDEIRAGGDPTIYGRSEVRRMLRDEIGRNEVRRVLRRRAYFSHPLVVYTFAALIGVGAIAWIAFSEVDRIEAEQARARALDAVDAIAVAAATHTERLDLLANGLATSGAGLDGLKARYDESRIAWAQASASGALTLRTQFGATRPTFLDDAMALSLDRLFDLAHGCLRDAYGDRPTTAIDRADGSGGLDSCLVRRGAANTGDGRAVDALGPRLKRCQSALVDVLARTAVEGLRCDDDAIWRRRLQPNGANEPSLASELYETVMEGCEMADAPQIRRVTADERALSCVAPVARQLYPRIDTSALSGWLSGVSLPRVDRADEAADDDDAPDATPSAQSE